MLNLGVYELEVFIRSTVLLTYTAVQSSVHDLAQNIVGVNKCTKKFSLLVSREEGSNKRLSREKKRWCRINVQ